MRVPAFVHWALVSDLILNGSIEASVLFGRRTAPSYQDLVGAERDGRGALVELRRAAITQLLNGPLILVDIVAQADLGVNVVAKEINTRSLILSALKKRT